MRVFSLLEERESRQRNEGAEPSAAERDGSMRSGDCPNNNYSSSSISSSEKEKDKDKDKDVHRLLSCFHKGISPTSLSRKKSSAVPILIYIYIISSGIGLLRTSVYEIFHLQIKTSHYIVSFRKFEMNFFYFILR